MFAKTKGFFFYKQKWIYIYIYIDIYIYINHKKQLLQHKMCQKNHRRNKVAITQPIQTNY